MQGDIRLTTDERLYYVGLPGIFREAINPTLVYKNYVKTYLERDIHQVINIKELSQFQRFMQLCASRIGSEFLASHIGNELGISYHTVQAWVSALEASYIIFRLQPYFENFGKRAIKSSKLYFTDVGLVCFLLGIENVAQLSRDPLKDNLFENLVILDRYKNCLNQGETAWIYFYRDQSQHEVDLICQSGRRLILVEIKYAKTFQSNFIKNLTYLKKLAPEQISHGYVVYNGDTNAQSEQTWRLLNYRDLTEITV